MMTGREIYDAYCDAFRSQQNLEERYPSKLDAWPFLTGEEMAVWNTVADAVAERVDQWFTS